MRTIEKGRRKGKRKGGERKWNNGTKGREERHGGMAA